MKKNIWLLIGIICVVIGTTFACFTDIADDIPALFVAAFGLGAIIVSTWNKSEKKGTVTIVSILCTCIGGFCCAIAGLAQDVGLKVIAAVLALVLLLISILSPVIVSKIKKE